jgi:site-specific recombinase XerD
MLRCLYMSKLNLKSNFSDAVTQYLEYCEIERNLSQNTLKMYDFYLHDFADWAKAVNKNESFVLADFDEELIKKYRIDLNRRISSKSNLEFKRSTQKPF